MDIRLPTIDGYETTRQIRAAGFQGPIVATTARAMADEIEKCHKSGCDACVSKPFDRATLYDTITCLLPGPSRDRVQIESNRCSVEGQVKERRGRPQETV